MSVDLRKRGNDVIPDDVLRGWCTQIINDQPIAPRPSTAREKAVLADLKKDIAKIDIAGGVVELPAEIAGLEG